MQARSLIIKLTEEKNNAIQQNTKLRQELVRGINRDFTIWIIIIIMINVWISIICSILPQFLLNWCLHIYKKKLFGFAENVILIFSMLPLPFSLVLNDEVSKFIDPLLVFYPLLIISSRYWKFWVNIDIFSLFSS